MTLSQALMFSLLCIGVTGCSGIQERLRAPFAARSDAGPNMLAAPLSAPASTITVAPQKAPAKLYNMDASSKKSSTQTAKAKSTRSSKTVRAEEAAPTARSVSVPKQTSTESVEAPAATEAAPATTGGADESLNLRPARKGESEGTSAPAQEAPQSAVPRATKSAVAGDHESEPSDVLPVSSPTENRRVDSKLSS